LGTEDFSTAVVAHEFAVHDVCAEGSDSVFLTAGFDGSIRQFDSRDLSTFSVIYQSAMPLLRLSVSPQDNDRIALFGRDATGVSIVDRRHPGTLLAVAPQGSQTVTGIDWCKRTGNVLFCVNDGGELRRSERVGEKAVVGSEVIWEGSVAGQSLVVGERYIAVSYGEKLVVFEYDC
jgi:hypothetical protein